MNYIRKKWGIILIFALWVFFSSDFFLRGLIPFPSTYLVSFFPPWNAYNGMPVKNGAMPDLITQLYPWRHLTVESWKLGEVPLWNPFSFSGTQHAGNYQSAAFSPFNFLFFILSEADAWSALILLQPLLAGLFMYGFIRTLKYSKAAGVIAAFSFMFCGFSVVWMGYGTLVHAVLWLPFILTGIHGYVRTKKWLYAVCIPVGIAASLVAGHFQISLYVAGFSSLYASYSTLRGRHIRTLMTFVLLFILGIIIALPQLIPAFNAYSQSSRSANFWNHGSIPFTYLITLFAPDFYGNPVTRNDWFGQYAEWASFTGVVPLMLALYAALRKRVGTLFFFLSAITFLLLATPTPLNSLLYSLRVPVISTSAGSRIIVLFSFCIAVLSGIGIDCLVTDVKKKVRKPAIYLMTGVGIFLSIFWIILLAGKIFPPDKLTIALRNSILPTAFAGAAFTAVGAGFFKVRKFQLVVILPILLISLTGIDSLRYAKKWMPFEPREYMFPEIDLITFLDSAIGSNRIYGTFGNELVTYFGFPSIEGYDAVYQARYGEFISAASDGKIEPLQRSVVTMNKNGKYAQTFLDLMSVRYLVHRVSDGQQAWAYPFWKYADEYVQVYKDPQYEVYENKRAYPRVRFVSEYEVHTNPQEIISALLSDAFPRDRRIVLEEAPPEKPQEGEANVAIVSETPNSLHLTTDSEVHKFLYVADVYENGWKAFIDGDEVSLYRANYAFRAISVPPGKHEVRFVYASASESFALYFSVGIIIVFALLSLINIRYEYRNNG